MHLRIKLPRPSAKCAAQESFVTAAHPVGGLLRCKHMKHRLLSSILQYRPWRSILRRGTENWLWRVRTESIARVDIWQPEAPGLPGPLGPSGPLREPRRVQARASHVQFAQPTRIKTKVDRRHALHVQPVNSVKLLFQPLKLNRLHAMHAKWVVFKMWRERQTVRARCALRASSLSRWRRRRQ